MKLIKNLIITEAGDKYLLINSLNGLMDMADQATMDIIMKWRDCDEIVPAGEQEEELFGKLKARGYLCTSHAEERKKKQELICALRERQAQIKANNTNLTFVMTYDCNFRCPYCFEEPVPENGGDDAERGKEVIGRELIDAAFNLTGDSLRTIGLFGGEPLLPKTMPAVEYIISRAPDKTFSITTNGYFLDAFLPLLSRVKISFVMVTLDGDEKTHDSRRYLGNGGPTFRKILNNIASCLERNIPIRIRMNVDESNFSECIALRAKLLEQFKARASLLSFEVSPMMWMAPAQRNELFTKLYSADIEYSPEERKQMNQMLSRFSPILNVFTAGARLTPTYSFCLAHDYGRIVDPYGYIYPCLLSVGQRPLAIGRYYPAVEYFENSIRNRNIETIPECRECRYSLLCGGGCPVALPDYNDFNRPECFSIQNQIHKILPMFFKVNAPAAQ